MKRRPARGRVGLVREYDSLLEDIPAYHEALDAIAAAAPEEGHALDVHARSGSLALRLAERGMRVTALAEGEDLERLREKLRVLKGERVEAVEAVEGGVRKLPRRVAAYDFVACALVLNGLSAEERPDALAALFQLVAPGGRLAALEIDLDGSGPFTDLTRLGRMLSGLRAEALPFAAGRGSQGFRAVLREWEARALCEGGQVLASESWAEVLSIAGFARTEILPAGRTELYKLTVAHKE